MFEVIQIYNAGIAIEAISSVIRTPVMLLVYRQMAAAAKMSVRTIITTIDTIVLRSILRSDSILNSRSSFDMSEIETSSEC